MAMLFEGAEVILPHGIERVSVRVEDGRITGLDPAADGAKRIDARGLMLAPALVDIHGDAFERQLMPRPDVFFPTDLALLETDRQLAGNGIATAYHALTLSWEPGLRSVARGEEVLDRIAALEPRLSVENRVQLRWETFCFEAKPLIARALGTGAMPSVAFNDHTSMAMLAPGTPLQERPFELDPAFPVADLSQAASINKFDTRAKRSGLAPADYLKLLAEVWERRPQVGDAIFEIGRHAQARGAPMLSHDDSQVTTRDFYRDHGARVTEFPMNDRVTRAAREAGDWIVFGAPNAVRGGSHIGSPSAADMVARGLCDILASDYFYPSMLAAVARLRQAGAQPLHALWKMVSTNPARAMHLSDRGEIAPGQRADLVLVDWPEGGAPAPVLTLSAGRTAFAAMDFGI